MLYIGAEYCPYCATERWAVAVALSRFGTFTGLGQTSSSANDVYPSTATLTFHGATYRSAYLSFTGKEVQSNQVVNGDYAPLDTLDSTQQRLLATYDSGGGIPFVDIGGRYMISGASYDPQVLQGKTHAQIAAALAHPSSPIAQGVDGTANSVTAAVCASTGDRPSRVCAAPGVLAAAKKLCVLRRLAGHALRGTRRRPLLAAALTAVALGLGACSGSGSGSAPPSTNPATGNPGHSAAGSAPASRLASASLSELRITGGYVRQPASPDVAAAYLTVRNLGARSDTLTAVSTDVTSTVMAMTETDSGGVGTMTDLGRVAVPARATTSFTPGRRHLMLENPSQRLEPGDTVTMHLTFARAGTVTLTLPVVPIGGPDGAGTGSSAPAGSGMTGMTGTP